MKTSSSISQNVKRKIFSNTSMTHPANCLILLFLFRFLATESATVSTRSQNGAHHDFLLVVTLVLDNPHPKRWVSPLSWHFKDLLIFECPVLAAHFLASHVHTYPSQETAVTQPVRTTKLYQTTVSQTWSTATQSNIMDLTHRPQVARQELQEEELQEEVEEEEEEEEPEQEEPKLEDHEVETETGQDAEEPDAEEPDAEAEAAEELAQFEFKRSADFTADQLNNFTNFSSSTR